MISPRSLEEKLDRISAGELNWKDVLRDFWKDFFAQIEDTKELRVTNVLDALNEELAPLVFPKREDGSDPRICQVCGTGKLSLKLGKYGAFVGCSNYPECNFTRQLSSDSNGGDEAAALERAAVARQGSAYRRGNHPALRPLRPLCPARRRQGGQARRACRRAGRRPTVDHEKALALLSLPRDIGAHPETGKMISSGIGRYGPFILHDGNYANVESDRGRVLDRPQPRRVRACRQGVKGPGRARADTPRR